MIEFPYQVKDGTVFIHCSTNVGEKARIETLLSQTKTICKIVGNEGKTGLRIVKEMTINSCLCAIFSLGQVVLFLEKEEVEIIEKIEEILRKKKL